MGDEQRATESTATSAAPPGARPGRDTDAGGSPAAAAAEAGIRDGGGEPTRAEAAATSAEADHRGLGARAKAEAETPCTSAEAFTAREALSLDDLEFHALRGIRYHEDRGAFLDLMRRCLDFLVVAFGTAAVVSIFAEKSTGAVALNAATAIVGALQLVAGLSEKAQEHRWARKKFCDLLARVTEAKLGRSVDKRQMRKLTKRWTQIWGDEPTTMHVLESIAHNATARALDRVIDPDELIEIPLWRSALRNILAQEDFVALTPREKREAEARKADLAVEKRKS